MSYSPRLISSHLIASHLISFRGVGGREKEWEIWICSFVWGCGVDYLCICVYVYMGLIIWVFFEFGEVWVGILGGVWGSFSSGGGGVDD